MTIKKWQIFILLFVFIAIVVGIYLMFTIGPWSEKYRYCDQFSGFHSTAWGGGSERCARAGCVVKKIREVDNPTIYDDQGFEFECVPKNQ